jgi:hypothetical protein
MEKRFIELVLTVRENGNKFRAHTMDSYLT